MALLEARDLTIRFGGVLEVRSTVGTGSTFAIVLPHGAGAMVENDVDGPSALGSDRIGSTNTRPSRSPSRKRR